VHGGYSRSNPLKSRLPALLYLAHHPGFSIPLSCLCLNLTTLTLDPFWGCGGFLHGARIGSSGMPDNHKVT
ncbi:MAG: hypothetical protein ACKVY0_07330, partial [Prosthecobacter sp.]|uniref:hypothetical protein n=1 Tax=Prosthecobacter sp. TaxID=1965333 RepID=UPI0038FE0CC3